MTKPNTPTQWPSLPRFFLTLIALLHSGLTLSQTERAPLRAPASDCAAVFYVNGKQADGAQVGDTVTIKVYCQAYKSTDAECLNGAPAMHGKNSCHLDGKPATSYRWRNGSESFTISGPDSATFVATMPGAAFLSYQSVREDHGLSIWNTVSVPVAPARHTPPPTRTTSLPIGVCKAKSEAGL